MHALQFRACFLRDRRVVHRKFKAWSIGSHRNPSIRSHLPGSRDRGTSRWRPRTHDGDDMKPETGGFGICRVPGPNAPTVRAFNDPQMVKLKTVRMLRPCGDNYFVDLRLAKKGRRGLSLKGEWSEAARRDLLFEAVSFVGRRLEVRRFRRGDGPQPFGPIFTPAEWV